MEDTLIARKVKQFESDVKTNTIELGSDKHLDKINRVRKPIVNLTMDLATLNKSLRSFFNSEEEIDQEDVKLLKSLNTISARFYAHIKKTKVFPYVKQALLEFDSERQEAKEIVNDFINFRVDSETLRKLKSRLK